MLVGKNGRLTPGQTVLPRSITRALNAMQTAPHHTLNLSELAAIGNVSARTLQRQFKKFLGKTPLAILRDIRFDYARWQLLRLSPTASITDIALRCGFSHLGRFSVEYRRRYGEKPSQTLARRVRPLAGQQARPIYPAPTQDRPTVAMVTETGSGNEELARGVAHELANALMRAGIAITDKPAAARYQLHSALRRNQSQARLSCRLIDGATGRHIWANRYDATSENDFFFEEHAAATLAGALPSVLRNAEVERVRRKPEADSTAYDLTLRALPDALSLERDRNRRALDLLGRAIESDSKHSLAIALAAWCHAQAVAYQFTDAPEQERGDALSLAKRALGIGGDATVYTVLGNAFSLANDLETADFVTQKALSLDGSSAWAWARSGLIDVWKGRSQSAIERLFIALDLAPDDPLAFNSFMGLGYAHFLHGRDVEAARWFQRAIAEHPAATWVNFALSPAYVFSGRKAEAQRCFADLQRVNPDLTISRVTAGLAFMPQPLRDRIACGLETLGLPA
jgi:AraC-like DNA-binding protein/tetratricopeptide (TPR) repeat protein